MKQLVFFLALALALPFDAQSQTRDRLDNRGKLFGFEAVGRLDSPSGRCTAALIARDVVLTAAHCVHEAEGPFTFRAAYSDGEALAVRDVVDVVIAGAYVRAKARNDRGGEIANDVALLRLASPINDHGIDPYAIAPSPGVGTPLTLASYGRGRTEALTLERNCAMRQVYSDGILGMNCSTTFGSSGAPVFYQSSGRLWIISVVSSRVFTADIDGRTLGTNLRTTVPVLLQTLRNRASAPKISSGARRLTVGDRTETGARFLRPDD